MRVHARPLAQATAMKRKFVAADLNSDGMVDSSELKETKLLDSTARLEDFDIMVVYGMMAALIGEKWADSEYRNFSVVEAVRLAVMFADYNNDSFLSRAESALLSMPSALFSALSPEGADGKQLSLGNLLRSVNSTRENPPRDAMAV